MPSGLSERHPQASCARIGRWRRPAWLGALALCLGLVACALPTPAERRASALTRIETAGWQSAPLQAGRFTLLTAHPAPRPVDTLAIFIEGDGLAWLNRQTPSPDPTPREPLSLALALAEPHHVAAYLARPCQFDPENTPTRCRMEDWTSARYSPEIVAALDDAVAQLKVRFSARRVRLVGYSGGGTLAALIAARRKDVASLITVAAVLDTALWTRSLGLSPLQGSLNPADVRLALVGLPQWHFVGVRDAVVGTANARSFVAGFPADQQPTLVELPDATHDCCWAQAWPQLSPP